MTRQAASNTNANHDPQLADLLGRVADGSLAVGEALAMLGRLPFEDLDWAKIDHHRALRTGSAEVIFCQGKTPRQVAELLARLSNVNQQVLGTRATREQYEAACELTADLRYHEVARCIYLDREPDRTKLDGIVVVCAGTSDLPVAEEAALTLDILGHRAARINDVGVAGVHRLLAHLELLQQANVIIAIAGMEGAMPSVIAGLVSSPVIAVPTSVGYGTGFGGIAALLGMLNSCAVGVGVVNIDNGFGAAQLAAAINRRINRAHG
ncbi:MAG: nickel pincer cofactor biosynthesis protein LarB [Phycisphaeraceae bacterium]|nr:nickel pincer cofactor biosynthesis protein LarB [Phycisphaeraceae bacterium]